MNKAMVFFLVLGAAAGFAVGVVSYEPRPAKPWTAAAGNELANTSFTRSENKSSLKNDSDPEVFGLLFQSSNLRGLAKLGAALDGLDSARIGALLDRLDRPAVENRAALMHRLMSYWAHRDPEAATAWMRPRLASFARDRLRFGVRLVDNILDAGDSSLVHGWAQNVPDTALTYAREHADTSLAGTILASVINGPQIRSDAERFALISSFPGGWQRDRVMNHFLAGFEGRAKTDYDAAERAALSLPPGAARDRAMEGVLAHWTGEDPAAALVRLKSLGADFPSLGPILAHHCAKKNPGRVAQWLESLEPAELDRCGSILVANWANSDPIAAFDWAENHGIALAKKSRLESVADDSDPWWDSYRELGRTPLQAAISEKPEATIEWLRIPDDKRVRIFREWMANTEVPEEWKKPWRMYESRQQ
jgi:hypothetical protein